MSETVLVQEPGGAQYYKKVGDVKPTDKVLHGHNISQVQAQEKVDKAKRATFSGGGSPQEAEKTVKDLAAKGWNVTGLQQNPNTEKWEVVTEGRTEPEYIAKIKSGSGTPSEKAERIIAASSDMAKNIDVNFSETKSATSEKIHMAKPSDGRYIYSMEVDHTDQIQDVETWAKKHGYIFNVSPEKAGDKFKIEILTDKQLPPDASIDMRSMATIRQQRAKAAGDVLGKKIYERATPIEKGILHVRTLLSPAGYEYVGSAIKHSLERSGPGGIVAAKTLDIAFPGIKTPDMVVEKALGETVEKQQLGIKPKLFGIEVSESVVSAIHNPVVDVELMFLGGAGFAKVGATKIGAKVLASKGAKIALASLGAAYAVERTVKVQTLRAEGKGGEALGTAAVAITGIAAGVLGYKAQIKHSFKSPGHKIEIDKSSVKGASVSKKVGKDTTLSRGEFKITEGKFKGLRGQTYSLTGKKGGVQITKIPAQKVGNVKIPAQKYTHFTKQGTISKLKLYYKKSSEGILHMGKKSKLVGRQKDESLTKIISHSRGKTRTGQDVIIRKFKGISLGKTASKYKIYLVHDKRTGHNILVEGAAIGKRHAAKIDWVDVSLIKTGGSARLPGSGTTGTVIKSAPKTAPAPPAPPSTMSIKTAAVTKTVTGPRIVPTVNPVPMPVRIKHQPVPEEMIKIAANPKIIRRTDTSKKQGRKVSPASAILIIKDVKIQRPTKTKETVTLKPNTVAIPITHPITGVKIDQKEKEAVLRKLEPVIDRIPSQPAAPAHIPNVMPKVRPPWLPKTGMIPFLRLGPGKLQRYEHKTGVLKNPVPKIEAVI